MTKHGICLLSVIPGRKKGSDASEMVTQLLFGDTFEVLEESGAWLKVETTFDNYECWIDAKQSTGIPKSQIPKFDKNTKICSELVHPIRANEGKFSFPILFGSTLPNYSAKKVAVKGFSFRYDGSIAKFEQKNTRKKINYFLALFDCLHRRCLAWQAHLGELVSALACRTPT